MELKITNEESELFFYNALCNGADYITCHGIELDFDNEEYKKAKKSLQDKVFKEKVVPKEMFVLTGTEPSICIEDILMEILRTGGKLKMIDHEGEGEFNREITLKDVHEKVPTVPIKFLTQMATQNDDADTADVILQIVFFNEIVFG